MSFNQSFLGSNYGYDAADVFKYRADNMCGKWSVSEKDFGGDCRIRLMKNDQGNFVVKGRIAGGLKQKIFRTALIKYWAADPPGYLQSYAGSGLPFANEEMAFENTVNCGQTEVLDGEFSFSLHYPNSYYKNMGRDYVEPEVKFIMIDENGTPKSDVYRLNLGNGIPYRSLNLPRDRDWNEGPEFYNNQWLKLPLRSQEQILRDSAFPSVNKQYKNFWGSRPSY